MDEEDRQHLLKLRQIHRSNLHHLEELAAQHGMDVPLKILNSIAFERRRIAEIDALLEGGAGQPP